jgi:hypothetical protein
MHVMKITAVVSDNAPNGPAVTHYDLDRMQICVPATWSTAQAIEFAESKWHSIANYHWAITRNGKLADKNCDLHDGHVHLNLEIEQNELSANTTDSFPVPIDDSTSHARVIISVDDSKPENILQTAANMDLLTRYLQTKAAAIEAARKENFNEAQKHEALAQQLNSQLLAQFPGTLIFL